MSFKIFDFTLLSKRREITINNEKIVDLCEPIVNFKKPLSIAQQPVEINEQFEGRPWLIAKMVYGSEDYTDLMLYFNGITNPYMVQRGMKITIYDLDSMLANIKDPNKADSRENESKKQFNSKLPQIDKNRFAALKAKVGDNSTLTSFSTPVMSPEGVADSIASEGRIILGTNVSNVRCKDGLSQNQTLTEKVREAVREKIKSSTINQIQAIDKTVGKKVVKPVNITNTFTARKTGDNPGTGLK